MSEQTMQKYINNDYEVLTLLLEYTILLELTDEIKDLAKMELKKFLSSFEKRMEKFVDPIMFSVVEADSSNVYILLLEELRKNFEEQEPLDSVYELLLHMEDRIVNNIKEYNTPILKLKFYATNYRVLLEKQFKNLKRKNIKPFNINDYV